MGILSKNDSYSLNNPQARFCKIYCFMHNGIDREEGYGFKVASMQIR